MTTANEVLGLGGMRRKLYAALEPVIFVLVILITLLVSTQVFTRYVLQIPVNWLEEAARMLLVWLVMLGAAVAAERREHYLIDFVVRAMPRRAALATLVVTNILGVVFLAILAVKGFDYFRAAFATTYVSLNVPRAYVYVAVPLGAVLMAFSLVSQSIEALVTGRVVIGPEPTTAPVLPHE